MPNNTDCQTSVKTEHGLGDDVFLTMGHKKYKASMAYAKALFNFAVDFKLLDPISKGFEEFICVWQRSPLMRRFIQCHAIDRNTRKARINSLFKDRLHKGLLCFLGKLVDNSHTELIPGIYSMFSDMADEAFNKRRVRVVSAFPLNAFQKGRLQKTLEDYLKLAVTISNEIDPRILGGFVCYTDSIKIDMSLKRDLEKLKGRVLTIPCGGDKKDEG